MEELLHETLIKLNSDERAELYMKLNSLAKNTTVKGESDILITVASCVKQSIYNKTDPKTETAF